MSATEIQRVLTGVPSEELIGYCRALKVGKLIYVTGTAPIADEAKPPKSTAIEDNYSNWALQDSNLGPIGYEEGSRELAGLRTGSPRVPSLRKY